MRLITRIILILVVLFVYFSCAAPVNPVGGYIGSPIEENSTLVTQSGIKSTEFFAYDETVKMIHKFDVSSMKVLWSHKASGESDETRGLVGDPDGKYVIELTKKSIIVINEDGEVNRNPFAFQGTPVSAAYNAASGYLIVYDDLQSVGIAKLNSKGKFTSSVLLGPLISENSQIYAGDIDDAGRLILSMSDKTLVVVNLAETLTTGAWVSTAIGSTDEEVNWIAPSNVLDKHVLATSTSKVYLINYGTGSVIDSAEVNSVDMRSKRGEPHVVGGDISTKTLYYVKADGTLTQRPTDNLSSQVEMSLFDSTAETIMVWDGSSTVLKYRLSDNLVVGERTILGGLNVDLGSDFFIVSYDAGLGLLEKHLYDSESEQRLSGYNLEYLQGK